MFYEAVQWSFDEIAKVGPLAVALAVYLANKQQNKWANRAAVRMASVEDQKLRLALLDRRISVMQHLRTARDSLTKRVSSDALGGALGALGEAQLVFEDDVRADLGKCLAAVAQFQNLYGGNEASLSGEELAAYLVEYTQCTALLTAVIEQLRLASRVRDVEPLRLA